jgi:hypothetical protein
MQSQNCYMCKSVKLTQCCHEFLTQYKNSLQEAISPRRYPYFDVVVGLVWSHDPKSYAGGSVRYW